MNKKIRGFEEVKKEFKKVGTNTTIVMPIRGSKGSAGYDFITPVDITIPKGEASPLIFTDIKAYMLPDEVLHLHVRSSIGIKYGLALANTTGIIDSDYYSNPDNDGNIGFKLRNIGDSTVHIEAGTRIIQGIFSKYLISDGDLSSNTRSGGFGSTSANV